MFADIGSTVIQFILNSIFSGHTYAGMFVGALASPIWMAVWNIAKNYLIKLFAKKVVEEVSK